MRELVILRTGVSTVLLVTHEEVTLSVTDLEGIRTAIIEVIDGLPTDTEDARMDDTVPNLMDLDITNYGFPS